MKVSSLLACVILLLTAGAVAQVKSHKERQKPIALKDIPKAVLIEFKREYPAAVIESTSVESDNGWKRYELHTVEGPLIRDILYDPDGTPMEIVQNIPVDELPQQVQVAVKNEIPKGKITGAKLVRHDADLVFGVYVRSGREKYECTYRSNGTLLEKEKK
jgi:hypothetical protein